MLLSHVVTNRALVWERLNKISTSRSGSWLMTGDFNEITGQHEKTGGRVRLESSFLDFRLMRQCCGMIDFPYQGNCLSWVGRRGRDVIRCRFDRYMGNKDWHECFSHSSAEYLSLLGSDHRSVLTRIESRKVVGTKKFRFDKRWLSKPNFEKVVLEGWHQVHNRANPTLGNRLANCRSWISRWRKKDQFNSAEAIEEIKLSLERAQSSDSVPLDEITDLQDHLKVVLLEEEIFWQQKSRVNWLQVRDKNTKYFHGSTKQRRARNRINGILNDYRVWTEEESEIEKTAIEYFHGIFSSSPCSDIETSLAFVQASVSPATHVSLTREVSEAEVRSAVFSIHPEKAPVPDGMTALFYQKFWHIIGPQVVDMVRNFMQTGIMETRNSEVNICLIPKSERPKEMKEFGPISLCNVSYKIISKVLCRRLKHLLPGLVSETQSAFVAGRHIPDNILLAQEAFHALQKNSKGKREFMAIKTDMSKAYDRVEWCFLEALMQKMRFSNLWITWIMSCVKSVKYSILLNGEPKGAIIPTRGLRQGDPLSSYMVILCTEVLIANLKEVERVGKIRGIRVARASPSFSHMLFADDSLFFCQTSIPECEAILNILKIYGNASGQCINFEKSALTFGKDIPREMRSQLKLLLGINSEGANGKYFGIPEQLQGSKAHIFAYVQDRLQYRINGWSAKLLSKGGKEVMIKSVAQAIPTYVMSCFLLPCRLYQTLESAIAKFWWSNGNSDSKGMHWLAWKKLCLSKRDGGIGFRTFKEFNQALLAKQLWRLHQFPNSLLSRVLKGKYFSHTHPFEAGKPHQPSYGWRSLWSAKSLIGQGIRRTIGRGHQTLVWKDNWISDNDPRPPRSLQVNSDLEMRVTDLVIPGTNKWDIERIRECVYPEDIPIILELRLPQAHQAADGYCWHYTNSRQYTVRSGYDVARRKMDGETGLLLQLPSLNPLKERVWKIQTTPKIRHFMWQTLSGAIAVNERLTHRHLQSDMSCPRCLDSEETINHLLFTCPPARQCWALSGIPSIPNIFPTDNLWGNMDFLLFRATSFRGREESVRIFPWILWFLWKARNDKVFNDADRTAPKILSHARTEAVDWFNAIESLKEALQIGEAPILEEIPTGIFLCYIDGSWKNGEPTSSLGWVLELQDGTTDLIGMKGIRRTLSPLHTEFHGLLWAMKCLHQRSRFCDVFVTDSKELTNLIEHPENWPSFHPEIQEFQELRLIYPEFTIYHRGREKNTRADQLANMARSQNSFFNIVATLIPSEFLNHRDVARNFV